MNFPHIVKTYEFPNAFIHRLRGGTYLEQPKWCLSISVVRSREYVREALQELRSWRKKNRPVR